MLADDAPRRMTVVQMIDESTMEYLSVGEVESSTDVEVIRFLERLFIIA